MNLIGLVSGEILFLLLALFAIVVLRLLTGKVPARGLLDGATSGGTRFPSAGRTQLLIASTFTAAHYLIQIIQNPGTFPDISRSWLLLFGGSQLFYLASKYYSLRRD